MSGTGRERVETDGTEQVIKRKCRPGRERKEGSYIEEVERNRRAEQFCGLVGWLQSPPGAVGSDSGRGAGPGTWTLGSLRL